jgi:putative lipoic acid-binding regulatory protein
MTEPTEASALQFPCDFPIKAMGLANGTLEAQVLEIVRRHAPELAEDAVRTRPSSNGKYVSITVTVRAQSREQLDAIYRDLSACEQVLMAL